jgi:hypothetical protein
MSRHLVTLAAALALCLPASAQMRRISLEELRDRVAGGWAGQMIGVSFGAPTEFRYREEIIPRDKLPKWSPEMVKNSLNQDDLYVDMTFAQVLDDKGLDATTEDFGAMFRDAKYALWHANLAARRALKRGVPATLSGTPKYNAHANDIDFQIEADFVGLMAPGMMRSATDIAWRAGRVMNYGDGIYGGIFVSCMYSAAFFENDPRRIVETGLACLPAKSPYARLIADVLRWHKETPDDWERVWREIEKKWNRREPCPSGALKPFNIDAKLNGAYIALGLLFGGGDMTRTIEISTQAGQDSDCNPSSAAGILGVMMGYSKIPDSWKSGIPPIAGEKFRYTNFSFNTIVDSTVSRAIALAKKNGGAAGAQSLTVRWQKPVPARYEVWDDYGSPVERIPASDARWNFSGAWTADQSGTKLASEKGASAEISFEGTGFIVVGPYLPGGGTADVFLDGAPAGSIDVYPDENARKGEESVWHVFGLKNGRHSAKIILKGERFGESKGTSLGISDLVVFR